MEEAHELGIGLGPPPSRRIVFQAEEQLHELLLYFSPSASYFWIRLGHSSMGGELVNHEDDQVLIQTEVSGVSHAIDLWSMLQSMVKNIKQYFLELWP